jgi:hypothetical protein
VKYAALVLTALACAGPIPQPLPRVLSASPTGSVAPDEVAVEIAFSAPIGAGGIEDGRFFALCRREDLREVVLAAESETGLASGAPVVPAHTSLVDGGKRAVLRPEAPLEPGRAWAAILSYRVRSADGRPVLDGDGKPRTVAVLFETGAAVDRSAPIPRWVLPPHGPAPSNIGSLRIGFDEPVEGALAIAAGMPGARALAVAPDVLGLDLSTPLGAGALAVDLSGVRDRAGNPAAALPPLAVSGCRSEAAPAQAVVPRTTPGLLSVTVQGALLGMGRLVAELSARPGDPACGAAPAAPATATWRGEVGPCPGWDPCAPGAASCPASLELSGLCPGQPIRVRLASEDLAGHVGAPGAWLEAAALPPRPSPVVTEVLADADAPEEGGEYVEVANLGTGDLDLAGYALAKRTAGGKVVRCTIAAAASTARVAPGAHALVVGGAYDGRYALPAGAVVYRCGGTALDGGLANDRPVALTLEEPGGTVVSTAGILEAAERCTAGALERVHPAGPDAASNWACPGGRSPGACNGSTPPAECPRRPW